MPAPELILPCLAIGVSAGLLAGLLGIGGGVVIVPALIVLFDAFLPNPHAAEIAVATSLATIMFTSLTAAWAQLRHGAIVWSVARVWAPALMGGSAASGFIASQLAPGVLPMFIAVFLLGVGLIMTTQWQPAPHRSLPGPVGSSALAAGAGCVSGLAGIGGGNVIVPLLVWHNVPMQRASATSSALGVPVAVAGTLGFAIAARGMDIGVPQTLGYVYLPAALCIIACSMLCAPLGVALAHRLPAATLKRIFGIVLLLVATRMLWRTLDLPA